MLVLTRFALRDGNRFNLEAFERYSVIEKDMEGL